MRAWTSLFSACVLSWGTVTWAGDDAPEGSRRLKSVQEISREAQQGVEFISVESLVAKVETDERFILLDVRTRREHEAGWIKGSAWVQNGIVDFVLARTLPDPDAEIVVYCKKGNRTGSAVKQLKSIGYTNVVGLEGGFDAWAQSGRTFHNFLGEMKMVAPSEINAASFAVDLYQDKK